MSLNYSSKEEEDLYYDTLNPLHYNPSSGTSWENPSLLQSSNAFYNLDNSGVGGNGYPSYVAYLNDDGYTTGSSTIVGDTSPNSTLSPTSPISPNSPHSTPSPDRHSQAHSTPVFGYNVGVPVHNLDVLPQLVPMTSNASTGHVQTGSNSVTSQLMVQLPVHPMQQQPLQSQVMNTNGSIIRSNSHHVLHNNNNHILQQQQQQQPVIVESVNTRSRTMTTRKRRSPNNTMGPELYQSNHYNSSVIAPMLSSASVMNNSSTNTASNAATTITTTNTTTSTRGSRKVATVSSDDDDEYDDRARRSTKTSEMIANSYAVKSTVARAAALTPIVMPGGDAEDDAELRRQRNKISASQYRKRRKVFVELLEEKVAEMEITILQQNDLIAQLQRQLLQYTNGNSNNCGMHSGHSSTPSSPVDPNNYEQQQYYTSLHHNPPPVVEDEAGSNISRWAVRTAVMFAFFSCLVLMAIPPVYTSDDYQYTDSLVTSMGVPELEIDLSAEIRTMRIWGRRLQSNVNDHYQQQYTPSVVTAVNQFDVFGVISSVQALLHWFSYSVVGVDPTSDSSYLWVSAFIFAMCIMTIFSTWTFLVATSKDCSQSKSQQSSNNSNSINNNNMSNRFNEPLTILQQQQEQQQQQQQEQEQQQQQPILLYSQQPQPQVLLPFNDDELADLRSRMVSSSICSDCTTDEELLPEYCTSDEDTLVSPVIPVPRDIVV